MIPRFKKMYAIVHYDEPFFNVVCLCNTENQAKRMLPIIAESIADNEMQLINNTSENRIEFQRGSVSIEKVPIVSRKEQVYHLLGKPE